MAVRGEAAQATDSHSARPGLEHGQRRSARSLAAPSAPARFTGRSAVAGAVDRTRTDLPTAHWRAGCTPRADRECRWTGATDCTGDPMAAPALQQTAAHRRAGQHGEHESIVAAPSLPSDHSDESAAVPE